MEILSVTDEGLGHTSHLVGLGDGTALVVDPARFPQRQRHRAAGRGWQIAWTADTHSHADYISGSPALAVEGAVFEDLEIADGHVLRAIPTPGHTPEHYPSTPTLPELAPDEAARLVADGAVLVDARPVVDFAAAHPAGAISNALRPVFGSWLGWLVDLDTPLVFLLDADQDRAELVRQALTVGHEHLLGEIEGGIDAWAAAGHPTASIPIVGPDAVAETVLDVRQTGEWQTGHVPGALHVELGAVRSMPVPDGPVTVMCGHGERAMTAASVLVARGHAHLTVLDGGPDDWARSTGRILETRP
ncbi:MAG: rhodanese-like domain-containing protein [Acidimicrobiia bacterium]